MIDFSDKATAVEYHRRLWNTIAEGLRDGRILLSDVRLNSANNLKRDVLSRMGVPTIKCSCPACQYSVLHDDSSNMNCHYCLLIWPSTCDEYMCIDYKYNDGLGLFSDFEYSDSVEAAADIADRIANLPVNEAV